MEKKGGTVDQAQLKDKKAKLLQTQETFTQMSNSLINDFTGLLFFEWKLCVEALTLRVLYCCVAIENERMAFAHGKLRLILKGVLKLVLPLSTSLSAVVEALGQSPHQLREWSDEPLCFALL